MPTCQQQARECMLHGLGRLLTVAYYFNFGKQHIIFKQELNLSPPQKQRICLFFRIGCTSACTCRFQNFLFKMDISLLSSCIIWIEKTQNVTSIKGKKLYICGWGISKECIEAGFYCFPTLLFFNEYLVLSEIIFFWPSLKKNTRIFFRYPPFTCFKILWCNEMK